MAVRPITVCWWLGMLTPAIRAMRYSSINNVKLTLALLMAGFGANHANNALALDDLAVAADPLH
jgi:hypothetical protein